MLARWDLKTDKNKTFVQYTNLQSGKVMDCGSSPGSATDILAWMVESGSHCSEVLFCNSQYVGYVAPSQSEVFTDDSYHLPQARA